MLSFNSALLGKLVGIVFLHFQFLLPKVTELHPDKPLLLDRIKPVYRTYPV